MRETIVIQWLGHACFKVSGENYSIVLDPYEDHYVPGLDALRVKANMVLCSHRHRDHGYEDAVQVEPFAGECPWKIGYVDSWHDEQEGALRGKNRIHILELGGLRVVHFGDQGCMLTKEQLTTIGRPDVLMIPMGGIYTIDAVMAKQIAEKLVPRVTIPMHYKGDGFGFDVLTPVTAFTDLYDKTEYYDSDTIQVDTETDTQIIVFRKINGA